MKKLTILLFTFTTLLPATSQIAMTLDDCLNYGFENNMEIHKASWDIASSKLRLRQSVYEFLPSADFEFNHFVSTGKSLNMETYSWGNENMHQGNLAFNTEIQVFQGLHHLLNRKMSAQRLTLSSYALEVARLHAGIGIIRSYCRVNLLKIDFEILQNGLADTRMHICNLQEQIASGVMATVSLYEMEAQEKKEMIQGDAAKSELRKEYHRLLQLMGWNERDSLITMQDSLTGSTGLMVDFSHVDDLVQRVLQHSVLLSEKMARFEMLAIQARIDRASLFPAISLQAGMTTRYLDETGDPGDPANAYPLLSQLSDNRFRQVALTVHIPLFDRNRNKLNVRLAEIERDMSEADIRWTRESLKLELQILREDIRWLSSAIQNAEIMTQAYAMSYTTAVEKYRSGILDLYSLHLAKNNHVNAQLELMRYIMEYSMNAALLSLYVRFTSEF